MPLYGTTNLTHGCIFFFFFLTAQTVAGVVLSVLVEGFVCLCVGGSVLVLERLGSTREGAVVHSGKSVKRCAALLCVAMTTWTFARARVSHSFSMVQYTAIYFWPLVDILALSLARCNLNDTPPPQQQRRTGESENTS